MYECFYVYLKIKNDKNEGGVVAKLSAHLSKSRVRFSTQHCGGLTAEQQEISNSVLPLRCHNIAIKKLRRKGHKNIVQLRVEVSIVET
jgi:hypothetical protein